MLGIWEGFQEGNEREKHCSYIITQKKLKRKIVLNYFDLQCLANSIDFLGI